MALPWKLKAATEVSAVFAGPDRPAGEHLARHAGVLGDVGEAAYAEEHLAQHGEGTGVAEDLDAAQDGAVVGAPGERGWSTGSQGSYGGRHETESS